MEELHRLIEKLFNRVGDLERENERLEELVYTLHSEVIGLWNQVDYLKGRLGLET